MGTYNPHTRIVAGNEYAPLLYAPWVPEVGTERGYQMRVQANEAPSAKSVLAYVDTLPPDQTVGHVPMATIYRRGNEVHSPARQIVLPCTAGSMINSTPTGGLTAAQALTSPADQDGVLIGVAAGLASVGLAFDVSSAPVVFALSGKRILDITFLYTLAPSPAAITATFEAVDDVTIYMTRVNQISYGLADHASTISARLALSETRLGWVNPFWHPISEPNTIRERQPFNFAGLTGFDAAGTLRILLQKTATMESQLGYAALRVTYCDENRVACAGRQYYDSYGTAYPLGALLMEQLRDPLDLTTAGVPLEYGDFTVTITKGDAGPDANTGSAPQLRAARSINPFPSHPGVLIVNHVAADYQPLVEIGDWTPAISLWEGASVGGDPTTVTDIVRSSHVYGRQLRGLVVAADTVSQRVSNTAPANDTPYPWLRFWCRHFGAEGPLRVRLETGTQSALVAVISAAEIDALPEVVDGWRQVTVYAVTPLLLDTGAGAQPGAPEFSTDSPTGWEVLIADSDTDPSLVERATYNRSATFYVTVDGVDYGSADLSFLWAQEPEQIGGVAATTAVQTLTPAGPDCPGADTACTPTGLYYVALSWTAMTSGEQLIQLGYVEIQRQDDTMGIDEWETVAQVLDGTIGQWSDYEARVGVASRYRLRTVHELGFWGPWSAQVTVTVPAPGVVVPAGTTSTAPVMIFTSNEQPDSNLAYRPTWDNQPSEPFTFPEGDDITVQALWGRDYPAVFRPAERDGVRFTRTLTVNTAAVTPQQLADGFTGLRDLAWADLPYVCVRTDTADRWLANISVGAGTVRRSGGVLYLATVDVIEVAGVPSPVQVDQCRGLVAAGMLPGLVYDHRYAVTPSDAVLDATDLDLRIQLRPDSWEMDLPLIARYEAVTPEGWAWGLTESGTMFLQVDSGGTTVSSVSDPVPFVTGDQGWLRVTYDADDGAAASQTVFYVSADGVSWTALGVPVAGVVLAAASPDADLLIGAAAGGRGSWAPLLYGTARADRGGWNGAIAQAQIRGDGGVLLAAPVFTGETFGTTAFTDSLGLQWIVTGGGLCGAGS